MARHLPHSRAARQQRRDSAVGPKKVMHRQLCTDLHPTKKVHNSAKKPPPARDGQPFQLANPGLVYSLDHPQAESSCAEVNKGEGGEGREGWEGIHSSLLINSVDGPTPPPESTPKKTLQNLPALFGDPMTRETLRRKLIALKIPGANKLLRTYTAAELVEAIDDFERFVEFHGRPRDPGGYFYWLLK